MEFVPFPKLSRLSRLAIVSEKIDGTNASVCIRNTSDVVLDGKYDIVVGDMSIRAASRTRWISTKDDNYGFAKWVADNAAELVQLGVGHHFGEWWGSGCQRGYGLKEKRFSLFNTMRWCGQNDIPWALPSEDPRQPTKYQQKVPICCHVVPELGRWQFDELDLDEIMGSLAQTGSRAAPGFMNPEGIVVFHTAANLAFKKTFANDGGKWQE
jgi:hypothetical protein